MKTTGWILISVGLIVAALSPKIVFPGLERLIGIESIVGKENVSYHTDGTYLFTNPAAMNRWILSVATLGAATFIAGIMLVFNTRKRKVPTSASTVLGTRCAASKSGEA